MAAENLEVGASEAVRLAGDDFSTCYRLTFGCETAAGNCEGASASLPLQRTADPRRVKWRTRTAVQPLSHFCSTLPFGT
jgi:hypothetical protein